MTSEELQHYSKLLKINAILLAKEKISQEEYNVIKEKLDKKYLKS